MALSVMHTCTSAYLRVCLSAHAEHITRDEDVLYPALGGRLSRILAATWKRWCGKMPTKHDKCVGDGHKA